MQERLIILSAGAFGREIYHLAQAIQKKRPAIPWKVGGFLDDRAHILDGFAYDDAPILGAVEDYTPQEGDVFVCAMGSPEDKSRYAAMIRAKGGQFIQLISPRALCTSSARLAAGCIVGPFNVLSCDMSMEVDSCVISHATIGHDVTIGRSCHISAYGFVGGGARIGDEVTLHPHVTILPGVVIGNRATVGAGSVVLRDVPEGTTVFGNPARDVKN